MSTHAGDRAGGARVRKSSPPHRHLGRAGGLLAGLAALLFVGWGLGALVTAVGQGPDADAVRDLAGQRDSLLTVLAHAFSWVGSSYVIVPLALLVCTILYRRGRRSGAAAIALSVAGGIVIANLDKLLVARPRPLVHHLDAVSSFSFPSEHTTQSTAFYLALLIALLLTKPSRSLAIAAAFATGALLAGIALARVYLGVHYPTDVAAGFLLGGSWSVLAAWIVHARSPGRHGYGSAR